METRDGNNIFSTLEPNIIYVIALGEQTIKEAEIARKICSELSSQIDGKINYLIDLNMCGKNSPEARDIWQEISVLERTNKVATFGFNPVARVLASFVIGIYGKKNMRFFATKEEAIIWLSK